MRAVLVVAVLLVGSAVAVTIADLALNAANCATLRESATINTQVTIPCACRLSTGVLTAVRCYPNCCPRVVDQFEGDRCHTENRLLWSVFEQTVCTPRPAAEYTDDTPNCFFKGNDPDIASAVASAGATTLKFTLSLRAEHHCSNLYIAECNASRAGVGSVFRSFRIKGTGLPLPDYCWLKCAPTPYVPCTSTECWAHRGETHANIREWTLPQQLPIGNYALVCQTLMQHVAEGSSLYQDAFSQSFFRIDP
jgi:hypothetical protein